MHDALTKVEDILQQSTKRNKCSHDTSKFTEVKMEEARSSEHRQEGEKKSYRDSVIGGSENSQQNSTKEEGDMDVSDDDVVEEGDDETWFGDGMTREEEIEARRPWRNSLLIKLVGRMIGYQFLWKWIQAMWRTESESMHNCILISATTSSSLSCTGGKSTSGPCLMVHG